MINHCAVLWNTRRHWGEVWSLFTNPIVWDTGLKMNLIFPGEKCHIVNSFCDSWVCVAMSGRVLGEISSDVHQAHWTLSISSLLWYCDNIHKIWVRRTIVGPAPLSTTITGNRRWAIYRCLCVNGREWKFHPTNPGIRYTISLHFYRLRNSVYTLKCVCNW